MKFDFGTVVVERQDNEGAVILRIYNKTADIWYAVMIEEIWKYDPSEDKYIHASMEDLIKEVDTRIGAGENAAKLFKRLAKDELSIMRSIPTRIIN